MLINSPETHYDIVIAGGGLVGGSFALLLDALPAMRNLRILLVDNAALGNDASDASKPFDARSTAISWGSRQIFLQAGLWDQLYPGLTAITDIHVSDKGHVGAARLRSDAMNVEALGYVAENTHLNQVIASGLLNSKQIAVLAPGSIVSVKPVPEGVSLIMAAGSQTETRITSRLLVIADGGRSTLCEQLGITLTRKPYGQHALISNISFEKPHQGCAFERFTDTGPLAVLPLPDLDGEHRAALVWTLTDDQVAETMALSDEAFLAALQQRFGYRLGKLNRVGERVLYPLNLTLASEQIRPGIVLLGNVAHTLHPVAGQGLNLALRDARELAEMMAEAVAAEQAASIGNYSWLQQYVQRQQRDQQQTVVFSDQVTRLFSNNSPLLALGRNIGLLGMDLVPPAKRWFSRQAMGMTDRRIGPVSRRHQ
ncbi:2-octaprenyl-6-methoxyphenyl hydroxylase [Gammaproteobacteria bacterium LSUCC0112]|nr:2-octaprenyl-6-methoxyphenyl hydroxylase [Gammaproteobacteria bacterium LSUCC0112]